MRATGIGGDAVPPTSTSGTTTADFPDAQVMTGLRRRVSPTLAVAPGPIVVRRVAASCHVHAAAGPRATKEAASKMALQPPPGWLVSTSKDNVIMV